MWTAYLFLESKEREIIYEAIALSSTHRTEMQMKSISNTKGDLEVTYLKQRLSLRYYTAFKEWVSQRTELEIKLYYGCYEARILVLDDGMNY